MKIIPIYSTTVYEDPKYLNDESEIENYFLDMGRELFDCGQGYCEDEKTVLFKIGDKFYEIELSAYIGSAKQDRGDRLYWVESISNVSYSEVTEPALMPNAELETHGENVYEYKLQMTTNQKDLVDNFLKEMKIKIM